MLTIVLCALLAAAFGGYVWWKHYRPYQDVSLHGGRAWLGRQVNWGIGAGREAWERRAAKAARRPVKDAGLALVTPPAGPPPGAAVPRPVPSPRLVPAASAAPAPPPTAVPAGAVPPDHLAVHHRIASFEPEDDAELLLFFAGEIAAKVSEGDAWRSLLDSLLNGLGLDPGSVAGCAEFADLVSGLSADAAMAKQQFVTVYGEVMNWAANGGVLPYNGRWLTGEGAA